MEGDVRQQTLISQCEGDAELRDILERMLAAAEEEDDFLETPLETAGEAQLPTSIDDFEIIEEVGRGGMGVVYRARQVSLRREVAIKVLPHGWCQSQSTVDRFHLEARTLARLHHPGIVTIFSEGVADNVHYFAMEFIDGPNLAELIRIRRTGGGDDDPPEIREQAARLEHPVHVANMIAGAAEALQVVHDAKVVHRDVKPSNLFLTTEGHLKVGDFGLVLDDHDGAVSLSGELRGSPYYMSPEQTKGDPKLVDARTDVYSLGVVLYELLTQKRPFGGKNALEIMRNVAESEPPSVRTWVKNAPRDLAIICEVAMAKDPEDRYANAGEMALDLRRAVALEPIQARTLPRQVRVARWIKLHRASLTLSAALLLASGLVVALALQSQRQKAELAGALDELVQLTEEMDLSRSGISAIGHSLRVVEARRPELSRPQLATFKLVKARTTEVGEAMMITALKIANDAQKGRTETRPWDLNMDAVIESTTTIEDARLLLGSTDSSQLALVDIMMTTWPIEVPDELQGQGTNWSMTVRELDPITTTAGPVVWKGNDPYSVRTTQGHFCLTVHVDEFAPMEFVRLVRFGEDVRTVRLSPRSSEVQQVDMCLIPSARVTFERNDPRDPSLYGEELKIGAYWIDKYEVSNRDYFEFIEVYPEHATEYWNLEDYNTAWDDLPVVGVPIESAALYAEWRGKRLPTLAELLYAGRGPEGRLYPWTDATEKVSYLGNCDAPRQQLNLDGNLRATMLANYVVRAKKVRSGEDAASVFGVLNLLGNVAELSCSLEVSLTTDQTMRTSMDSSFVTGGNWFAAAYNQTLANSVTYQRRGRMEVSHTTGFRCALTAD